MSQYLERVFPMNLNIIQPIVLLMLHTIAVWAYMYILRIHYIVATRIPAQNLITPEQAANLLPERINLPSYNLKNLFEVPVIFYVLCISLALLQLTDVLFVNLAWTYVALRVIHSLIHCTVNHVASRFVVYVLSSLVLWIMVCRLTMTVF